MAKIRRPAHMPQSILCPSHSIRKTRVEIMGPIMWIPLLALLALPMGCNRSANENVAINNAAASPTTAPRDLVFNVEGMT